MLLLSEVESSIHSARPVPKAMAKLLKEVDLHVLGVSDLAMSDDEPFGGAVSAKPGGGGVRDVKLGDEVCSSEMERRAMASMVMFFLYV